MFDTDGRGFILDENNIDCGVENRAYYRRHFWVGGALQRGDHIEFVWRCWETVNRFDGVFNNEGTLFQMLTVLYSTTNVTLFQLHVAINKTENSASRSDSFHREILSRIHSSEMYVTLIIDRMRLQNRYSEIRSMFKPRNLLPDSPTRISSMNSISTAIKQELMCQHQ